jgi:hypothetical protein
LNLRHSSYRAGARWASLLLALLLAILLPPATPKALAQTTIEFLVNSTEDAVDADLVDDLCDADPGPEVKCTLRAAVIQSNVTPGKQTIRLQPLIYRLTIAGANESQGLAGDLDLTKDVDIIGSVAGKLRSTIDATGLGHRVFRNAGAHVSLQQLTITGGGVTSPTGPAGALEGGAIFNQGLLTISDSVIRNNSAVRGGAIFDSASLTIERTTISDNRTIPSGTATAPNGGGIASRNIVILRDSTIENNTSAGSGGGLSVEQGGTIQIERSLIAGNSAQVRGGGINVEPVLGGSMVIDNSTLSANHAASQGGAISALNSNFSVVLRASTIAGNSAPSTGGISAFKAEMTNMILANNLGNNCSAMQFVNSTFNLSTETTCDFTPSSTNKHGISAKLGPLAFNGGPTRTHALLPDSPAIDGGKFPTFAIYKDQRGAPRVPPGMQDGNPHDMGAFEFNAFGVGTFALTPPDASATVEQTATLTLTWTHPERWRELNTVDVQLRHGEAMPLWVRFSEGLTETLGISVTNGLTLYNSDGTLAGVGEVGEALILESDTAALDLAQSHVQGSGPQGRDVTLTLAVRLREPTAGKLYAVTLLASEDSGEMQGPNEAGTLAVGPFTTFLPLALR